MTEITVERAAGVDRPEKGYANGRARRDQIVEEATRLFAKVGYHSATILEIAASCNISRAGLLHHFPTKESLLYAVLEQRDAEDLARFRASGSQGADGLGILRGMVELAAHNSGRPGIIELYTVLSAEATDHDHPAHGYFVDRYERIRSGTRRALERANAAGYLVAGTDLDAVAIELTALMDGLQLQWLLAPEVVDMPSHIRARIQRVLTVPL